MSEAPAPLISKGDFDRRNPDQRASILKLAANLAASEVRPQAPKWEDAPVTDDLKKVGEWWRGFKDFAQSEGAGTRVALAVLEPVMNTITAVGETMDRTPVIRDIRRAAGDWCDRNIWNR